MTVTPTTYRLPSRITSKSSKYKFRQAQTLGTRIGQKVDLAWRHPLLTVLVLNIIWVQCYLCFALNYSVIILRNMHYLYQDVCRHSICNLHNFECLFVALTLFRKGNSWFVLTQLIESTEATNITTATAVWIHLINAGCAAILPTYPYISTDIMLSVLDICSLRRST